MKRIELKVETLALAASLFFTLAWNGRFWAALTAGHPWSAGRTWLLVVAAGVLVTSLQWFLLLLVLNRWTAKPLLAALALASSVAVYFMAAYDVPLGPAMLRNALETDAREAAELLDWKMALYVLLFGVAPVLFLWRVRVAHLPLRSAAWRRLTSLFAAAAVFAVALWASMHEIVPVLREHRQLGYLVTPSNYLYSAASVLSHNRVAKAAPRLPVALDAHRAQPAAARKPTAFVLVVGETVNAQHWGLGSYRRQTTPELAGRGVVNFADVTSCGTDTATSLPCMFSLYGRRHYDEESIRRSESVLHVLARVGVSVLWRDNQSGCKGVCDGLPLEHSSSAPMNDPELCAAGRCFDAVLMKGLAEKIAAARGDVLIVLHMLGNHGPAYYQRYPREFRRWLPTCDTTDLASCPREALHNTYDNAILYTDHLLAQTIDVLAGVGSHDVGLMYVSDHGESLGERNLYLHGMYWRIAPDEQKKIPLVLWLSPGLQSKLEVDPACLSARAAAPASHDNLFHTALGLFEVRTSSYEAGLDLTGTCRTAARG